jgi:hypothetical protein
LPEQITRLEVLRLADLIPDFPNGLMIR